MSLSTLHEQLRALRLGHFTQALQQQQAQPDTYTEMSFEERLSLLATHELLWPSAQRPVATASASFW